MTKFLTINLFHYLQMVRKIFFARTNFNTQGLLFPEYVEELDIVYFAFSLVKKAYESLYAHQIKKPPNDCSENGLTWDMGKKIYE